MLVGYPSDTSLAISLVLFRDSFYLSFFFWLWFSILDVCGDVFEVDVILIVESLPSLLIIRCLVLCDLYFVEVFRYVVILFVSFNFLGSCRCVFFFAGILYFW